LDICKVWAVTIGGTILQNYIVTHLPSTLSTPSDASGQSTSSATFYTLIASLERLPPQTQVLVKEAVGEGLRHVWIVMAAIAGAGMLCSFGMRGLPLSGSLDKKWGVEEGKGEAEGDSKAIRQE
jgi:hypothetical protein